MSFCFNATFKSLVAALIVCAVSLSLLPPSTQASAVSLERVASRDSYVSSSYRTRNYGTAKVVRNKAYSPTAVGYVTFDMAGVTTPVARATLKFYAKSSNSKGLQIRSASGPWQERAITFSNAPGYGAVEAMSGGFSYGRWVSVDVTPVINRLGAANLAFTSLSGSYADIASREVVSRAPRLILEPRPVEPSPDPSPAPTPAPSPDAAPQPVPQRTYFVDSMNGRDSNAGTSPESAWQTLEKAGSAPLVPGESLLLKRDGSWTGTLALRQSGSATAVISVGAYGSGASPVIRGGGSCVLMTGSNISVSGIEARDCLWAGVEIKGSNNKVQNSLMTGSVAGVVIAAGASGNIVSSNQIKDNNKMSTLTQTPENDDSGAFGILINGDLNEIASNTISGSDTFSYDYGRDGSAVEIYAGRGNNIHHNQAFENDTFAELGDARSSDNVFAYNVVRSSLQHSLFLVTRGPNDTFGPVSRTSVVNNSVALTGSQSQGVVCYAGCSAEILKMRNNIVHAVWKVGYADNPFDEDYGLFSGGQMQFTAGSNSLRADPGWADPVAGDLHLKSSSPAVDKASPQGYSTDLDGVAVPLDGDGDGTAAPDRGAFELRT